MSDAGRYAIYNPSSTAPVLSPMSTDSEVQHVPAGLGFVLSDPKRGGGRVETPQKRDALTKPEGSSHELKGGNVWTCPKRDCGFSNNFQHLSKCYKCRTLRPEARMLLNQSTAREAIKMKERESYATIMNDYRDGMLSMIIRERVGSPSSSSSESESAGSNRSRRSKRGGYTTVPGDPPNPVRRSVQCHTAECNRRDTFVCTGCGLPHCKSCLHSTSPALCRGCQQQAHAKKKQAERERAERERKAAQDKKRQEAAAKKKSAEEAPGKKGGGGGAKKRNRSDMSGNSSSSGRNARRRQLRDQPESKPPAPPQTTTKGLGALLEGKSKSERNGILHTRLYDYIVFREMDTTAAGKIASLVNELEEEEVISLLSATDQLDKKIKECKRRLSAHESADDKPAAKPEREVGKKNRRADRSSSDTGDAERNAHARYVCASCKGRVYNPALRCKKCNKPVHEHCNTIGYCKDCLVSAYPHAHESCKVCNKTIGAKDPATCPICKGLVHKSCMRGGVKRPHCKDCPAPPAPASRKPPKESKQPAAAKVKPVPVSDSDAPPVQRDDIPVVKLVCGICPDQDQGSLEPERLTSSCKCGAKICDKHNLPEGADVFDGCRVCETRDDHPSAHDNPPSDPAAWNPGTAMELGVIRTFFGIMEEEVKRFPIKHVEEWELRKPDLCKKVMSIPGRKDCVLWLKDPEHWVYLMWDGSNIKRAKYMESMKMPHDKLEATLQGIGVTDGTPIAGVKMARFKERDGIELSCGPCAINNGFALRAYGGLSDDPLLPLSALQSKEAFRTEVRRQLEEQAAELTENDMEHHKGVHRRPMSERIKKIEDLPVAPPADFPESTEGLHRAQVNLEAIPALTSDRRVTDLLSLTHLVLPKQTSIRSGVSEKQRRKHLYVLLDVINLLSRETKPILSLEEAMVRGIDLLAAEREWSAATTKVNYANCLYGAILRINQYTGLTWTANLALDQTWKDAMTTWTKKALCHVPKWTEVPIEAVHRMIAKASSVVKVWIMLSWASTGRPGNLYSLQWTDLVFSPATKEGYKVAIQWRRHHKTMEKVGAYTNHSWIPNEWYKAVMLLKSTATSEWLLPLKQQRTHWAELTRLVKEECPDWDLRSFRRGALSTMARNGVPLEVLLQFSGHKNIPMLLRYLQFGLHAGDRAEKAAVAAQTAHTGTRFAA